MSSDLEWTVIVKDCVIWIFDKSTFPAFQTKPATGGIGAMEMITEALAKALGSIVIVRGLHRTRICIEF
jgi:hypothetical protein